MKILKLINFNDNNFDTYEALASSVYLKKKGHQISVIAEKKSYAYDFCDKNKINLIDNNFYLKLGFINLSRVDIIEIYGYNSLNSILVRKLLSLKTPKILRLSSFPEVKAIDFIKKNFDSIDLITVISQSIKDELIFSGVREDKIMLLNPILLMSRWESAKQIKPATFLQRPYRIAMVYRNKNYEYINFFMNLAKEVLKSNYDVSFSLIGPKDEKIRETARILEISHKVDVLGWRDDMPEIMAMAHIYVKCDTNPNISRSLIEAMASSVVCLVPRVKGISDFIISDYSGIIVEAGNIHSYVKNIVSLINEPFKMENISNTAYNIAKANYNSDIAGRVDEIIYQDIMRKL